MSIVETYVIRIYRRAKVATTDHGGTTSKRRSTDRVALAGLIEDPVSGETRTFHAASELIAMLSEAPKTGKQKP